MVTLERECLYSILLGLGFKINRTLRFQIQIHQVLKFELFHSLNNKRVGCVVFFRKVAA